MNDPAVLIASAVSIGFLGVAAVPSIRSWPSVIRSASRWVPPRRGLQLLILVTALTATGRARPGNAEVPPPMVRLGDIRALPSPGEAAGTYTVMPGDSLWRIAARHLEATTGTKPTSAEIDRFWRRIYSENARLIGADPDLIFPGQRLRIPTGVDDGT